jgi:hypothetical protein
MSDSSHLGQAHQQSSGRSRNTVALSAAHTQTLESFVAAEELRIWGFYNRPTARPSPGFEPLGNSERLILLL